MCFGSMTGAMSWIARMQELNYLYLSESDMPQDFSKFLSGQALKYYWKAVFSVFYSLEFAFLSIAKLLVLDRLATFALPNISADVASAALRYKVMFVFRATIFAALAGDATGVAGNIASAVYCVKIGNLAGDFRAIILSNTSAPIPGANSMLWREISDTLVLNNRVQSVQLFSEVAVLVVIVVVVASFGALCIHRIHDAQLGVPNTNLKAKVQRSARTLKLRVVRAVLVIFVAFTLRSAFAIMYAAATTFANIDGCDKCSSLSGGITKCNQYDDLKRFLIQTPVLQCIVIFIASPVALGLTLWSMTPKHMLRNVQRDAMHPLMEHSFQRGGKY